MSKLPPPPPPWNNWLKKSKWLILYMNLLKKQWRVILKHLHNCAHQIKLTRMKNAMKRSIAHRAFFTVNKTKNPSSCSWNPNSSRLPSSFSIAGVFSQLRYKPALKGAQRRRFAVPLWRANSPGMLLIFQIFSKPRKQKDRKGWQYPMKLTLPSSLSLLSI